ncbi:YwmB family TATA-box binding protein [Vallitalea guaymasensis]|uniref:YwmB family TATA-box binding protein n=1 Tax=Vallitalea guaymasensis TaxID=1185412 RepID=A0A8J8SCK5_9FIRM|nr:YwmB family TATA-box binding protein [Vallitalea guaymasensis]QUH29530.1 YwmB family TATA-box binding protein [Vallitalea guaymasensis]
MLKKITCIILVFAALIVANDVEKMLVNGEEKLLTTFNEVNFTLCETDLNMWGEYSKSYMTEPEMEKLALEVVNKLGLEPEYNVDYNSEEFKKVYSINKKTEEADTTIKVVELIEEVANNGLKVENYIVINIVLNDKCGSILYFRDKITEIFQEMNMDARDNLTITSKHKGKLDESKAKEIVKQIANKMSCQVKDSFKTENIYSIYGYSRYIDEHIITEGEKINVDLALTYNELEDMTYLYAAIPVITIDY